jgi:CRP-like cAMP-binding protein
MSLDRDIAILARVPLFEGMAPDHLRLLAFSAVRLEIPAGSVLFEKGASAKSGYIVARGSIHLVEGEGAGRRVVAECPEGTLIGETALFVETVRPATAIAVTDTQVIDLGRAGVTRMVREYPEVAVQLHARLARRLSGTVGELVTIGSALTPIAPPPLNLPDAG